MNNVHSLITRLSSQSIASTTGWGIGLYLFVWKLGRKYISWFLSPLKKLPGPRRSFLFGTFPEIMKEPFMKPHTRWWKEAIEAEASRKNSSNRTTTDKENHSSVDSNGSIKTVDDIDIPMLSYSSLFGNYSVIVLDADIVQDVFGDSSYSKENPKYVKKYEYLKYLMGEGLVTLEGPDWSRHRRIIQPSFQTSILERTLDESVPDLTQKLISSWKKAATGSVIDLDTHLQALTLDIIGQAGFSYDFDALDSVEQWSVATTSTSSDRKDDGTEYSSLPWKDYVTKMKPLGSVMIDHPFMVALRKRLLAPSLLEFICLSFRVPRLIPILKPSIIINQRKLDLAADIVVQEAIEKLKTQGEHKSKSLLQLLLNATDDSDSNATTTTTTKRNFLSMTELRDEVKTFLIAGHETTSTWCYWALYALIKDPTLQDKVYQDILRHTVQVADDSMDRKQIGLAEVNQMEYLAAFLNEVLRFYPPVGMLFRVNTKEVTFKGQKVPVNTRIGIAIQLIHRHPKYWGSDANVFRPERWLEKDANTRHPFCFLPFSAGARNCIGYRFSKIEAKIILANIIKAFIIQPAPCMRDEVELTSTMTLKSKPLVKVCVIPRI